jgi:hypothetical protein
MERNTEVMLSIPAHGELVPTMCEYCSVLLELDLPQWSKRAVPGRGACCPRRSGCRGRRTATCADDEPSGRPVRGENSRASALRDRAASTLVRIDPGLLARNNPPTSRPRSTGFGAVVPAAVVAPILLVLTGGEGAALPSDGAGGFDAAWSATTQKVWNIDATSAAPARSARSSRGPARSLPTCDIGLVAATITGSHQTRREEL